MTRKKRIPRCNAGVLFEALETRRLLSALIEPLPSLDAATGSAQVQPVAQDHPTYKLFSPADGMTPLATAGPQGYPPSEIRTAYGLNQITFGNAAGDGSGQTIAIVDAYNDPTILADLHAFDAAFGLADPTLRVVAQNGGTTLPAVDPAGAGSNNWEGEEALDVEWAHAMAPGANIILVEAADSSPSNLFAAVDWARQQSGVSVISMSWGGNETPSETQYDSILTTPVGHAGVTFVASTGDSGAPAGYPALSPNVVAAGGTSLALDNLGNYQLETGWSGSGGGVSGVETQPAYQSGVVTQSQTFRTNPDVAFVADPSTGVSIYDSYNNGAANAWEIIGGTSVAAPCWAGILAVADQGRVTAAEGTMDSRTQTLPLLYTAPGTYFHDVTTGNNGFAAGSGYDLVTGRGSPKANLLVPYLISGAVVQPPPTTGPTIESLSANAVSVTQGTGITLTATGVSDPGASGLVVTFYQETNGVAGLQTDPATGDFAFTPVTDGSNTIALDTSNASPGTYTFYAQLTDSSGAASSVGVSAPTVTVTITAPSASIPSIAGIAADPNPVVTGNPLTLTAIGVTDSQDFVRRVYFFEETNGIPGLQTGPGGDFAFRPTNAFSGFSLQLDTTGFIGSATFYALAVDNQGNVSADGTAAPSVSVDVASNTVPATPTGLTATAVSPSEIDLAFHETDSGQTGFTIQRSTSPTFDSFTQLFTVNRPSLRTYSDTGLSPSTHYYYRVEAFDLAGDSSFSNTAGDTTFEPATSLLFGQQPSSTVAGHTISPVVVDIQDALGQIIVSDNSSVTLAIASGPAGAILGGTVTAAAINGVATFSNLSLTKAGAYTLFATDGTLTAGISTSFTITEAAPAQLAFGQLPVSAAAGSTISPPLTVRVEDAYGNLVTTDSSNITLAIASGPLDAILGGTLTVAAAGGVATFSNLSLNLAGTYTLTAADGGTLTAATSTSFIIVGDPSQLAFIQQPSTVAAGSTISPPVTVDIEDAHGNLVTTDNSAVSLVIASGPGTGTFTDTSITTVNAVNGVATFHDLSLTKPGTYVVEATDGTLNSAISHSFAVDPATPSIIWPNPADITYGTALSDIQLDATASFNGVAVPGTFVYTPSAGNVLHAGDNQNLSVVFTPTDTADYTSANASAPITVGQATPVITWADPANIAPGTALSAAQLDASANVSGTLVYAPAAGTKLGAGPHTLSVTFTPDDTTDYATVNATAQINVGPSIASISANGPVVTGNHLTLTATDVNTDSLAAISSIHFYYDTMGTGVFNVQDKFLGVGRLVAGTVNNYALIISTASLPVGTAGFFALATDSRRVTSSAVSTTATITPAAPAKLVFTTRPVNAAAGATMEVVIKIEDAHGNVETSDTSAVTLSLASGLGPFTGSSTTTVNAVGGQATFSNLALGTAGTYKLTAADPTDTLSNFNSSRFKITPGDVAGVALVQQPPASAVAGTTIRPAITVVVKDPFGNVIPRTQVELAVQSGLGALSGVLIAKTSNAGIAAFPHISLHLAGTYTLVASAGGVTSAASDNLVITAARAAKMVFFAPPPTTLTTGSPFNVTLEFLDAFGNLTPSANGSTVVLSLTTFPTGATLVGTLTAPVNDGWAVFNDLSLSSQGVYKLKAIDHSVGQSVASLLFVAT